MWVHQSSSYYRLERTRNCDHLLSGQQFCSRRSKTSKSYMVERHLRRSSRWTSDGTVSGQSRQRLIQQPPMTATTTIPIRHFWAWHAPVSALILWIAVWVNLDTGFWNIKSPTNGSEWQLMIRAVLPFGVLPVAALILFHRRRLNLRWSKPSSLLMIYGALATLASVFSPDPFASFVLVGNISRHDPGCVDLS